MLNDKLFSWLKEGESEHLAFRLFFGHETIETLVAFANLHGGVLLLGISELREIKGIPNAKENIGQWLHAIHVRTTPRLFPNTEIIEVEGKSVVCISVTEYPVKPVASEGKYYKRIGKFNQELTVREVIDFRRQFLDSCWDSKLRSDKTIVDISFTKLHQLIERISRKRQCPPEEPLAFLRKYSLAEENAVTNACWLLLLPGESPETVFELGRFSSPTVASDTLTLKSDLFTEAEEAMRFICKHIQKEMQPEEPVQWQYPLQAIRELIVNMIIHRDYTADYSLVVKIFDGYIEFYNPGAFPNDLSIKQLLTDIHISRPRNSQISELFKDAGMFDEYGSGIKKIHSSFVDSGLRPPEYIKLPGRLIVRVFGETSTVSEKEKQDVTETVNVDNVDNIDFTLQEEDPAIENMENTDSFSDLDSEQQNEVFEHSSEREQQILALILEDNRIPLNKIAQELVVSKRTILRDIKRMKEDKIIERVGNEKNGYWQVKSNSLP